MEAPYEFHKELYDIDPNSRWLIGIEIDEEAKTATIVDEEAWAEAQTRAHISPFDEQAIRRENRRTD